MATRERPADRGRRLGEDLLRTLGREARDARQDRGLSLRAVAGALGTSATKVWRVEHALCPSLALVFLARLFGVVGLDLFAKGYAGPTPLRDASQNRVLTRFLQLVHPVVGRSTEVVMPTVGDPRRWDAMLSGPDWRYGVEAETAPTTLRPSPDGSS